MSKKSYSRTLDRNNKESQRISAYLDQETIKANREIDRQFYGEDDQENEHRDNNLYNMGDSTPIINDEE